MPNPQEVRPTPTFVIEPDVPSLLARAAERIAQSAANSISERGAFSLVLSGGSTPKSLYQLLADDPWREHIDWQKTHLFWGDERWVPSTDQNSNYRMTRDALISKVPIPPQNVHRVPTDNGTPGQAALSYENELQSFFGGGPVIFDLILLGLGTNGHTASLFPHRPILHETAHLVASDYVEEVGMHRITMTAPVFNMARSVAFIATGAEKADVVQEVVNGSYDPERLPAQLIRPAEGNLRWFLDAQAAAKLPGGMPAQQL